MTCNLTAINLDEVVLHVTGQDGAPIELRVPLQCADCYTYRLTDKADTVSVPADVLVVAANQQHDELTNKKREACTTNSAACGKPCLPVAGTPCASPGEQEQYAARRHLLYLVRELLRTPAGQQKRAAVSAWRTTHNTAIDLKSRVTLLERPRYCGGGAAVETARTAAVDALQSARAAVAELERAAMTMANGGRL